MNKRTIPSGVDPSVPSPARTYDYWLGGRNNFPADRRMGEKILEMVPELPPVLKANRAFLERSVRYLATAGIKQFLDLGTGIPTPPNVHDTAHAIDPAIRVVYVDNDPSVIVHNRGLLTAPNVVPIEGDVRRPEEILAHPEVQARINFDEPIGILVVALFHFITDEENPRHIIKTLTEPFPPGSYLALSTAIADDADPDTLRRVEELYAENATAPFVWRTREQVARLFGDWPLVDPGLVRPSKWRPELGPTQDYTGIDWFCGAVARKPA